MKNKLGGSISTFITSLILLFLLPGSSLTRLGAYLRHYGPDPRLLKHLWRSSPSGTLMLLITLVVLVVLIISFFKILYFAFFRILYFAAKLKSGGKPEQRSPKQVTEEAINCGHRTGRAKYLEQIDSFLRNGLIDRTEYNVLKARYEQLNIPDDYHG